MFSSKNGQGIIPQSITNKEEFCALQMYQCHKAKTVKPQSKAVIFKADIMAK